MNARRGHTLIEATVVITMFGVILSTVALALHATRQANRHVRDESAAEVELTRFAAQLRSDAHQAASARLDDPKPAGAHPLLLSLVLADNQTVDYTLQPQRIQRELRRGKAVMHRETYRLPASLTSKWLLRTGDRFSMVSLALEPVAGRSVGDTVTVPCRVDAAVHLFRSDSRKQKP